MKLSTIITWIPRVLSILLTLALYGFLFQFTPENIEWPSFIYALIPGTVLFLLTLLAWQFPKPGGILFILLGVAYAVYSYNQVALSALIAFSGTTVISGVLYFLQKRPKVSVQPEEVKEELKEGVKEEEKPVTEKVEEKAEPVVEKIEPVEPEIEEKKEEPVEVELKEELPPLPERIETEEERFTTKEPPGAEAPPVKKTPESKLPVTEGKLPAWKQPEKADSLPDISLTTGSPTVSGDDLGPKDESKDQTSGAGKKTDGPSQEFMKWVEKQKLK